jgi:hypothetical protein
VLRRTCYTPVMDEAEDRNFKLRFGEHAE